MMTKSLKEYIAYMETPLALKAICNGSDEQLKQDLTKILNIYDEEITGHPESQILIHDDKIILKYTNTIKTLVNLRDYNQMVLIPRQLVKDIIHELESSQGLHVTDLECNIKDKGLSWILNYQDLLGRLYDYKD